MTHDLPTHAAAHAACQTCQRSRVGNSYASPVEYGVSVGLELPENSSLLDPLQAEGAASLLSRVLEQVEGAEGHEGGEVLVDRHWVGAYPEGAVVLLVVDAGSLEIAEAAARGIMLEVLQRSELLAQWQVTSCEVGFDERFAEAGLQVVDGAELPPADPAERARWHAEQRRPAGPPEEVDWRAWIKGHETLLRAFDLDVFDPGDGDPESAQIAAGALMMAATIVIDELFQDVTLLGRDTVADSGEVFMVLEELPERFAHHYDGRFARNFLIAMIMVTGRLAEDEWTSPASVAEALALHVVVKRARVLLDMHEVFDEQTLRRLYHGFDDAAYDDVDHEWLYRRDMDGFEDDPDFAAQFGVTAMQVRSWFDQVEHAGSHVHPFAIEVDRPTTGGDEAKG